MKKSINYLIFGVIAIALLAFIKVEKQPEEKFNESFAIVLEHAKEYTLEVAKAMPEDKYSYRPNDSVRSFGEQMAHIGMSSQFIHKTFILGEEMKGDPAEMDEMVKRISTSKEETIKTLETSFDQIILSLKGMDEEGLQNKFVFFFAPNKPEFSNEEGFIFIRDHITHHRAQAIVYLRMNDLVPPAYRAF